MSGFPERAAGASARRRRPKRSDVEKGRVRVHDPFELIRWLALSQPDPRKALAELVQNSLDAGAHRIQVTRVRERGQPCLRIRDDGEGVIPELDRPDALRYIATHIGHSRKRSLSPQQRLALMTQGQYGIGLLGFWSLGEALEIRSSVPYQRPHRLVLYRDRPDYLIEPLRGRLVFEDLWTEVVVVGLHREAIGALAARRAADYLGSELRGQLLEREVELSIEDKIARGRALRSATVKPPRFLGERLEGLGPAQVPGHPPIRLEIYLQGEEVERADSRGIAVYAAGSLVAEGFRDLAALGLDHEPWTDARLTGLVDFPGLRVAPGSRRGVIPDEAAGRFAAALLKVEPLLLGILEARERERAEQIDRNIIRDLQRAFRDFYRQRPRFTMLPVRPDAEAGAGPAGVEEQAVGAGLKTAPPSDDSAADVEPSSAALFAPGPLEAVKITPSRLRLECCGSRRARAQALDAANRAMLEGVAYRWSLSAPVGVLTEMADRPGQVVLTGGENPAEATLLVVARSGEREASSSIPVEVLEELPAGPSDEGIPEPELVDQPGAIWRSRFLEGRWQVNSAHPDYKAIADRPALKLRFLALLFAKEVVLRSAQDPRLEAPLEQVVEVAAYADRRLGERVPRRRNRRGENHGGI
jgi:hypothetical protein